MNPAELAGQVSSHRPLQVQSRRSLRWATMDETHGRLLCDRSTRRKAEPYLGDACCTSSGPPDPEDRRHSLENQAKLVRCRQRRPRRSPHDATVLRAAHEGDHLRSRRRSHLNAFESRFGHRGNSRSSGCRYRIVSQVTPPARWIRCLIGHLRIKDTLTAYSKGNSRSSLMLRIHAPARQMHNTEPQKWPTSRRTPWLTGRAKLLNSGGGT